jgi:hypothetical protein
MRWLIHSSQLNKQFRFNPDCTRFGRIFIRFVQILLMTPFPHTSFTQ